MVVLTASKTWQFRLAARLRLAAAWLLAVVMLFPALPDAALAADQPLPLFIDGQQTEILLPLDGQGLVPLRPLCDALGAEITWFPLPRMARVRLNRPWGDKSTQFQDGYKSVTMKEGRLWVPLADAARAFDYDVAVEPDAVRLTRDRTVWLTMRRSQWDDGEPESIRAVLDEYNWTVVSGQVDPALGVRYLKLRPYQLGSIADEVTVPVDALGNFTARLRLEPGKSVPVTLYGWAHEPVSLKLGTADIRPPAGPGPLIPSGEGITVDALTLRPEVIDLETEGDETGQLILTMRPHVPVPFVQVWLYGLDKAFTLFRLPMKEETAQVKIPLPGPAAYELTVNLPDEHGLNYQPALSLHLVQHEQVERDNEGINTGLVPELDSIPEGDFADFVPISGTTAGPGDGFILALVSVRTAPGPGWYSTNSISSYVRIPVVDGRFETNLTLRLGPGEYQVTLGHPISNRDYELDSSQRFVVRNLGSRDLRWLAPTYRVESDHPEIIRLARELTANQETAMAKARAIYGWVTRNITYDDAQDLNGGGRHVNNGAVRTLGRGTGDCEGYAYLTAALLRASGVEARLVSGSAGTKPPYQGHAWLEALVDGRWVTMDPTWDAAVVRDGKVILPAAVQYFDPKPETFALDHQFREYRYD